MPRPVHFDSDGLRLSALLWSPERGEAPERRPGVVMACGFGGMKEFSVPGFARCLAEAGYVALTFDYRGFGESEGPRWRLIPSEQVRDLSNAATFLCAQDDVDPVGIGIWGVSFGGGNAVAAAATDARFRCVISVNGVADGLDWMRGQRRYWEWCDLLDRLERDRAQRVATGASEMVDMYEIMVPDPATLEAHTRSFAAEPQRRHGLPLETAEAVIAHRPITMVDRVAPRAALWIHSGADRLVPPEQSVRIHAAAGEPRRLVLLPGLQHHDVYGGAAWCRSSRARPNGWRNTCRCEPSCDGPRRGASSRGSGAREAPRAPSTAPVHACGGPGSNTPSESRRTPSRWASCGRSSSPWPLRRSRRTVRAVWRIGSWRSDRATCSAT